MRQVSSKVGLIRTAFSFNTLVSDFLCVCVCACLCNSFESSMGPSELALLMSDSP